MLWNKKRFREIILIIFVGVCLYAIATDMSAFLGFLGKLLQAISPIIIGLCIAFIMNVLMRILELRVFAFMGRSKRRWIRACLRPLCLSLTIILIFGIVALAVWVIVPEIIETIQAIAGNMQSYAEAALTWITGIMEKMNVSPETIADMQLDWKTVSTSVIHYLQSYAGSIANKATGLTADIVTGIYDTLFEIIIAVYVLAQKEKIALFFKRFCLAFFKKKTCDTVFDVAKLSFDSFAAFIRGQFAEGVILGSICFICMKIFGFPYAATISLMIGIGALIPIVGAWVSTAIGALLIFTTSPVQALLFVLFIIILQQLDGNLIYPRVVGETMGLPSLIVIGMVLVGGNLFGVVGILFAVPFGSVIYTLIKRAVAKRLDNPAPTSTEQGDFESSPDATDAENKNVPAENNSAEEPQANKATEKTQANENKAAKKTRPTKK